MTTETKEMPYTFWEQINKRLSRGKRIKTYEDIKLGDAYYVFDFRYADFPNWALRIKLFEFRAREVSQYRVTGDSISGGINGGRPNFSVELKYVYDKDELPLILEVLPKITKRYLEE